MRKIYFRANGSNKMGLGHIYRSCALAEILKDDFNCHFLISSDSDNISSILAPYFTHSHQLKESVAHEAQEVRQLLTENDILVLDGYSFDTAYQTEVKASHCKLVCVDDIFNYHFVADVVINHAGGVSESDYSLSPDTKLFLGPAYAIIRQPFVDYALHPIEPSPNTVLITLGGADPDNYTARILNDFLTRNSLPDQIHVVAGAKYKSLEALEQIASQNERVTLHINISADDMANLMASSALCIATPSTVSFEYLTASQGSFVMQVIADNQKAFRQYLKNNHFATDYADFKDSLALDAEINIPLIKEAFDGMSHARLLNIFNTIDK